MKRNTVSSIAFLLVTAVLFAAAVLSGNREFSENENRALQTRPELSGTAAASGEFQSELERYLSDQFFARDALTAGTTVIKKLTGRRDIGGAYLGSGGYYLEMHTAEDFDKDGLRHNLGIINSICECFPSAHAEVMLVPCAACVLADRLPAFASCYDPDEVLAKARETLREEVSLPDIATALRRQGSEDLYYKTDHHWTASGALAAYRVLTGGVGAYHGEPELFCGGFFGTTYSKTLDPAAEPDDVYVLPIPDSVKAEADGVEIPVYDAAAKTRKDKYTVFFGGNHGTVVLTGGADNGRTAMIIKDSFANCFAPMLTADYETVVMIDPRYFAGSLSTMAGLYRPDELLFIFEMSNLAESRDLVKLLM